MADLQVAGMGVVSGYGWGAGALWDGLASGVSAGRVQQSDGMEVLCALVPEGEGEGEGRTRVEQAVLAAADEAVADARGRGWAPRSRLGVIHCTGIGDIATMRDGYFRGSRPLPSMFPHVLLTAVPSLVAHRFEATGPNIVVNAACASVNAAVLQARGWIRAGAATDVLVTAADFVVIKEIVTGFRLLRVLVDKGDALDVCRPFQTGSRGFFLGDAACAFVLSGSPGIDGYVSVLGGAFTHDAHHLTAVEPSGTELARCFADALADAGVDADDVAYVNAHGTGTRVNDEVEGAVIDKVFGGGGGGGGGGVYSTKPLTGHGMGASAGIELAVAALSHARGLVPAPPVVAAGSDRLVDGLTEKRPGPTLCSSIGLGGYNAVLVIDNKETPR